MTSIVVAAVIGALVVQAPAALSGFNGVWVLDAKRSALMNPDRPGFELSIADTGKSVKATQSFKNPKAPGGAVPHTYAGTLDGRPTEDTLAGLVHSRLVTREGSELVWQVRLTRTADNVSTIFSERWSVSGDGETLTIRRVYRTGRTVTEVFTRKR